MSATVDATFYVSIEPTWGYARPGNERPLIGAKAVSITQKKPTRALRPGGAITAKLTLRLPAGAFLPLRPEAIVVVPEGMTEAVTVEVLEP